MLDIKLPNIFPCEMDIDFGDFCLAGKIPSHRRISED